MKMQPLIRFMIINIPVRKGVMEYNVWSSLTLDITQNLVIHLLLVYVAMIIPIIINLS